MGKVAVITGANHGIGAAIAKELAFTGYNVVMTWLNPNKYAYSHIDQTRMFHTMVTVGMVNIKAKTRFGRCSRNWTCGSWSI